MLFTIGTMAFQLIGFLLVLLLLVVLVGGFFLIVNSWKRLKRMEQQIQTLLQLCHEMRENSRGEKRHD